MVPLLKLLERAIPALLMASSVVLLSAGIFAYAPRSGDPGLTFEPGDPNFGPTPSATSGAVVNPTGTPFGPLPSAAVTLPPHLTFGPTFEPSTDPLNPTGPPASPGTEPTQPAVTSQPGTTARPGPTPTPRPNATSRPSGRALATRIVIPSMNIDLAVVSGDLVVPGNRNFYPLCDVAQYLMEYSQPGERGTTYLYAHARSGMFLPLLTASQRNNGRSMIGKLVEVYTSHNQLHLYEIYLVKRHATDLSLAHELPPGGQQLIMQTSEGPRGTVPKLQVAARPVSVVPADPRDANPTARPRACR
ncbi:MAG TPA: hypothetical protein VNT28_09945 [Candidatus Limnocylindrales bacterium]|jgi:hypothetical protein|nr:hypothetical protein [Candidatus Limnocylindrales bacterium]